MNIHHRSHTKFIVAAILIALVAAGGVFAYCKFFATPTDKTQNETTTDTKNSSANSDNSSTNNSDSDNQTTTDDTGADPQKTPPQVENPVDQTSATLNITVNSAQIVGNNAQVLVTIDQLLGTGTCTLTIGNYQTAVPVVANPQSSSCEGFSVPLAQIGNARDFTLQVVSGDKSGTITGTIK